MNARPERTIAALLAVPAVAVLPIRELRWFIASAALALTVLSCLLHRAVRSGWASPWVSLAVPVCMSGGVAINHSLALPTLVMLTAHIAYVTHSYGGKYGFANIAIPSVLLVGPSTLQGSLATSSLVTWLIGAVIVVGIIGESGQRLSTIVHDLGLDVWSGTTDGDRLRERIHPHDTHVLEFHRRQVEAGADHELRYRVKEPDGQRWLLELIHVNHGQPSGVVIDITHETEARDRLAVYADLVESIGLGLVLVELDPNQRLVVLAANPASESVTYRFFAPGRSLDEALPECVEAVRPVFTTGTTVELPGVMLEDSGRRVRVRAFPLPGYTIALTLEPATNLTLVTEVSQTGGMDPLTGLADRTAVVAHVDDLIAPRNPGPRNPGPRNPGHRDPGHRDPGHRDPGHRDPVTMTGDQVAVLHCSVTDSGAIATSFGHEILNDVLAEMTARLRRAAPDTNMVGRIGAAEFVMVIATDAHAAPDLDLEFVADTLRRELGAPIKLDGCVIQPELAVGVAVAIDGRGEALVRAAEHATEVASGLPTRVFCTSTASAGAEQRLALVRALPKAMDSQQLVNHYQPIVDLRSGRIVGAETLVRWRHPDAGLIGPRSFIDLAEITGLGPDLATAVTCQALADVAAWTSPNGPLPFVAINLSAESLHDLRRASTLKQLLRQHGVDPSRLHVELSQASVDDDLLSAAWSAGELRALGIEITVDDFGFGTSSINALRQLPIDEVKLDQSVVSELQRRDTALVRPLIELIHGLGLRATAVGVETDEVFEQLVGLGCDRAQGYLFGQPMSATEFSDLLHQPPDQLRDQLRWSSSVRGEGTATVTALAARRARRQPADR